MATLEERLQSAVGDTYRIERELGGGGMSRVFLAEEVRLGRKVVIKVLPPDMAAGVNMERFEREIRLAAKLQHPHIVPLLTAGVSGDLLYYVMPYIEGESLRAKLAREGELPVNEAVRVLREVVDALMYAHEHAVVHRDIKPDNVLLSSGHAVVTDFGVAKAVSASSGSSSLTSLGVALGTPAYMAPEQAAADPHVDHRADVYAVGALAYEMLTGRPPFTGTTPQQVLAAHVSQAPEPVTQHRETIPPALAGVIMRCLAKRAADRWQTASELRTQLDAVVTPSGGMTGTQGMVGAEQLEAVRKAHPVRVAGLFGFAAVGVLAVVYLLLQQLGLPDWVFLGAIVLLAIGLPIMLLTGHHERQRAMAQRTGVQVATPTGLRRHFTWGKAILGGALAFTGLTVVTGGYMAMRLLGIGPVGTLVAAGVLDERGFLIVAEFVDRAPEGDFATSVTEALRIDLSQSTVMRLMDASTIREALRRMDTDPETPLSMDIAREIAEREGVKAIVTGDVGTLGSSFVVSARLLSTADGSELVALRETATDDAGLVGAVDRLSGKLRERIGESLRSIRTNPPLARVSTASLAALRKYTQGVRAFDAGDYDRAIPLLEEAIQLDTTFAMAYRKLAAALNNTFADESRQHSAATLAYRHRNRLPDLERYLATAYYHTDVDYEPEEVRRNYLNALDIDPENLTALNNLALLLNQLEQREDAEQYALRAVAVQPVGPPFNNAISAQVALGAFDRAEATLARFEAAAPDHPEVAFLRGSLAATQRDYATAQRQFQELTDRAGVTRTWQRTANYGLAALAEVRGQLAQAERLRREELESYEREGRAGSVVGEMVGQAEFDLYHRDRPDAALEKIERILARYPLSSIDPLDRPYFQLIRLYAVLGRPERSRQLLQEYEREVSASVRRRDQDAVVRARGQVALADGQYTEAVSLLRQAFVLGYCPGCASFELALAHDRAGELDSAVAVYERSVSQTRLFRYFDEAMTLPHTYRRLGELHEQQGSREKAVEYYNKFVDLWKDADPELQPRVREVTARIARLVGEG